MKRKKPNTQRLRQTNSKRRTVQNIEPLPAELLRKYPRQYIIFSEDEKRVIGAAKTEEEAFDEAHASGVGGLWHVGYSEWD